MNNGFKSFSQKLHNKPVKILNVVSKFLGMSKPSEIYYTIKDGNWNDLSIWETVSGRKGKLPSSKDDVYIHNNINVNVAFSVNNLFIKDIGSIYNIALTISVNGNLLCNGTVTMTTGIINLYGEKNFIQTFNKGTTSTVVYTRIGDQTIMDLSYHSLTITCPNDNTLDYGGFKTLCADLTITGNLTIFGNYSYVTPTFETLGFNVTVLGSTSVSGIFSVTGASYLLFHGLFTLARAFIPGNRQVNTLNFIGDPTVEFRGGINMASANNPGKFYTGTGLWKFTTNSQSITAGGSSGSGIFDCQILIGTGVTLTVQPVGSQGVTITLNNWINGEDATSSLINRGTIYLNTLISANYMTVGFHDFTSFSNIIGFTGNYSYTIVDQSFWSLTIGGTGTKTQASGTNIMYGNFLMNLSSIYVSSGNTTVNGTTNLLGGADFDMTSYDWYFVGVMNCNSSFEFFRKTGPGNVIFGGYAWFLNCTIVFSGNPTVDVRNGIRLDSLTAGNNLGSGTWSFTTNSQTMIINNIIAKFINILVVGPITLTNTYNTGIGKCQIESGTLEGTVAGSTFLNSGYVYFNTLSLPMTTGVFDKTTTLSNTVGYVYNGDLTIPYSTYQNLYLSGTGLKTPSSNLLINGTFVSVGSAFDLLTYDIEVIGTTTFSGATSSFVKSTSGTLKFGGVLNLTGGPLTFSGNPDVEFKGGYYFNNGGGSVVINTGTGTWRFKTNNQTGVTNYFTLQYNCAMIVDPGVTFTFSFGFSGTHQINNYIDGTDATSKVVIGASTTVNFNNFLNYGVNNGTLDVSTYDTTNSVGYIFNGDITLPFTTYGTLLLGGTGTKTLSGNTLIKGNLTVNSVSTIDLTTYDLTVNGATAFGGTVIKNSSGNLTFYGLASFGKTTFNVGNPTLNFYAGVTISGNNDTYFGTGLMTFNNTANFTGQYIFLTINNPILINGAITLTISHIYSNYTTFNGVINGNNALSKLLNASGSVYSPRYNNATMPMVTGILDCNTITTNTFTYGNGNQDIKGGTYRNLTLNGTGVKTLQGNVSVLNTYTLTAPATKNNNGFTFGNP